jgi:hypothetical protein
VHPLSREVASITLQKLFYQWFKGKISIYPRDSSQLSNALDEQYDIAVRERYSSIAMLNTEFSQAMMQMALDGRVINKEFLVTTYEALYYKYFKHELKENELKTIIYNLQNLIFPASQSAAYYLAYTVSDLLLQGGLDDFNKEVFLEMMGWNYIESIEGLNQLLAQLQAAMPAEEKQELVAA